MMGNMSGGYHSKRSILVVEDNEINREMLRAILEDDYIVIEAEDGLEGLEKLRENLRDLSLILLDVQMPRMNGYEFLEVYRADAKLSTVPVIVTTGSSGEDDEARCLMLGASDFVTKPYKTTVMLRRIEAIIRLHESIVTLDAVEHDDLTGLHNRAAFNLYVKALMERNPDLQYDMMMLNVEDFSFFNERYGEQAGDELLKHIGKCMKALAEGDALCCRYDADRFVVIGVCDDGNCEKQAEALNEQLHQDAFVNDFTVKFAAYKNVEHDVSINVLCDRLAMAMEGIRHQYNNNFAYYDSRMSDQMKRSILIEACMEEALEKKQFTVYYQPKHDPYTGKVVGAEALVRWIHPEYGFMSPGEFIPLFEKNGFISRLDTYVWRRVCEDIRRWKEQGIPVVPVSVNASRRDFAGEDCEREIDEMIAQNGVEIKYRHVDVTESLCTEDDVVFTRIKTIHEKGFQIELDDFGSGYSSLGMIQDIPMDIIKLDASFVRQLEKKKEIVRLIISFAHAIGVKIVSEGVETQDQLDVLKEFGCDYIQGYFYSKPLPVAAFEEYCRNNV